MKAITMHSCRRKDVGATLVVALLPDATNGATTRVAPIGANLRCAVPPRLPPPLWGRVGVGGRASGHSLAPFLDPTPDPSPQGGGEEFAAPLQRKLAPMRVPLQRAMWEEATCAAPPTV